MYNQREESRIESIVPPNRLLFRRNPRITPLQTAERTITRRQIFTRVFYTRVSIDIAREQRARQQQSCYFRLWSESRGKQSRAIWISTYFSAVGRIFSFFFFFFFLASIRTQARATVIRDKKEERGNEKRKKCARMEKRRRKIEKKKLEEILTWLLVNETKLLMINYKWKKRKTLERKICMKIVQKKRKEKRRKY